MSTVHDQARGLPISAGDLQDAIDELEERFGRIEHVIGRVLTALDSYPDQLSKHLDDRIAQDAEDRELAHSVRADFERLASDPAHSWLKDHPMKRNLALMSWVQNSDLSLDEVVDRLEKELFNALVAEGVPPAEAAEAAEDAAEAVGDNLDPGDHRKTEEKNAEGVMAQPGKLVSKSILTKLRDKVAAGSRSALTRDVERGGKPVIRTSAAGSESGSARPPKGIAPGVLARLDARRSK